MGVSVHVGVCSRARPGQPQHPPARALAPPGQVVRLPVELPRGAVARRHAVAQRKHRVPRARPPAAAGVAPRGRGVAGGGARRPPRAALGVAGHCERERAPHLKNTHTHTQKRQTAISVKARERNEINWATLSETVAMQDSAREGTR